MSTLDISVAWSVAVPVDILGAHLQAYVQLQPTINAIRLCNRYGTGPKATINKLPIELITEIEAHVMEHERVKKRGDWVTDLLCFQGTCRPVDHFSESEEVRMWNEYFEEVDRFSDCTEGDLHTELTSRKRDILNEVWEDMLQYDGPEEFDWWTEHESRVARWKVRAGFPHDEGRGLLSTYSPILLCHFGLQMWITHAQPKEKKQGLIMAWTDVDVCASTTAYLTLPSGKVHDWFERAYSERLQTDEPFMATENGGGVPVPQPGNLSQSDMTRFARAIKILGLTPNDSVDGKLIAPEILKDETGEQQEEDLVGHEQTAELKNAGEMRWSPKLRVLYRSSLPAEI